MEKRRKGRRKSNKTHDDGGVSPNLDPPTVAAANHSPAMKDVEKQHTHRSWTEKLKPPELLDTTTRRR